MSNELKVAKVQSILSLHAKGWTQQRIAETLDVDRGTVARYLRQAAQSAQSDPAASPPEVGQGISKSAIAPTGSQSKPAIAPTGSSALDHCCEVTPAPIGSATAEERPPTSLTERNSAVGTSSAGRHSQCEPWRGLILAKAEAGLSAVRIHQDLVSEHGAEVSYDSVRRLLKRLSQTQELPFRRMECSPGDEIQVDFGTGAPVHISDGKRRRPHLFRAVLSYSRKGYTEASWRQTTEDFIRLLENTFWTLGGVPKAVVLDNLKAAVKHPDWYDPELNPKLEAFCQHYGCVLLPTKPRTPRHKGKTERGVGYAQDNALSGRSFASLEAENQHLAHWEATVADTRIHGTTKKHVGKQFLEVERPALQPLPPERFPFFHEGRRRVSRDGHVEVAKAYYSVPPEYLGRCLWVRWDGRLVRIFNHRLEQIALHPRQEPGRFSTLAEHIHTQKISGVERGAQWLLTKVRRIGPHTTRWAEAMLENRGIQGVRVLQGLRSLATRYSHEALEEACQTALSYQAFRLRILRELLKRKAPPQKQFEFIQEHAIIRPMAEYQQFVAKAIADSTVAPQGFLRHSSGVRGASKEESPGGASPQGSSTSSTRPRSGYPSSGCSSAEPDSVSPDHSILLPFPPQEKLP